MKQYVFTMMDDVCTANHKTEEQKQSVLKKLAEYGTVESYDSVVAQERAKYQSVIDNQTRQIEAIHERELTDGEMSPLHEAADVCLCANTDMASFVDSLAAPLSVINALVVSVGLHRREELAEHFKRLEGIWNAHSVYIDKKES